MQGHTAEEGRGGIRTRIPSASPDSGHLQEPQPTFDNVILPTPFHNTFHRSLPASPPPRRAAPAPVPPPGGPQGPRGCSPNELPPALSGDLNCWEEKLLPPQSNNPALRLPRTARGKILGSPPPSILRPRLSDTAPSTPRWPREVGSSAGGFPRGQNKKRDMSPPLIPQQGPLSRPLVGLFWWRRRNLELSGQ